ncbi:MAG: TonB-dependent receptor [Azoarcus sp.]|nr:TonB-dependent receptor [Azoarcus sp.]
MFLSPPSSLRMKPLRAAILGSLLLVGAPVAAQDGEVSVESLQKQVEDLRKALEESQRELAAERARSSAVAPAETPPAEVPADPAAAAQESESAPTPEPVAEDSTGEQSLEAVVIKRRKVQPIEELKETPKSVSVVTGAELENLGATDVTQVLNRIGNVNFNYGNPRTGSLTLRGITTGSNDQIGPTVGTEIDGVPIAYTPLSNGFPFVDIDSVGVARGPVGTRGGRISNIGRITFKSKKPTFTPEANISVTLGEWDTLKTSAVVGGPVVDGLLAWRGTILREQGDGPWETQFKDLEGRGSYKNVDRTFGRVQLLFTPSENFKANLSVEHQPKGSEWVNGLSQRHPEPTTYRDGTPRSAASIDTAYKKYQRDWFNKDPALWDTTRDYYRYPVYVDNNGAIITSSKGWTLNAELKVPGHTIESITSWRSHWFSAANDEGTPYDVTKSGGYITSYSQRSQELRLTSDKDDKFEYVAGLFFLSSDNDSLGGRTRWGNDAGAYQANNAQYAALNADGAGQAMLRDSLNGAYKYPRAYVKNKEFSIFGETDWHITAPLTLTTGARVSWEKRRTDQENVLDDPGVGANFSKAFGITTNTSTVLDTTAADALAQQYFGSTYASLSAAQQSQLQQAAAVRNGALQQGTLYARKSAKPWEGEVYAGNIALTDKINENLTVYGTVQYGEKGGIAQLNSAGESAPVDKERTTGLEIGFRSSLFNDALTLNADVFINEVKDFQTTVAELDPAATAAYQAANPGLPASETQQYQSLVGNLPKVRIKGVEIDALYKGVKNLTLRLAASYNDARYADDTYLAQPSDIQWGAGTGRSQYYNVKGETLSNAPKFTAILGADYRRPILGNWDFHAAANYKWTSAYYTSNGRPKYNRQDAYGLLDVAFGIGRRDGAFDANIIIRNALDEDYHVEGWSSYTPATPRWAGIVFSSHF